MLRLILRSSERCFAAVDCESWPSTVRGPWGMVGSIPRRVKGYKSILGKASII